MAAKAGVLDDRSAVGGAAVGGISTFAIIVKFELEIIAARWHHFPPLPRAFRV